MPEDKMETTDLLNVPIFSAGKWEGRGSQKGGDNITEKFLDDVVKSFQSIGDKVKPRMIIGHDDPKSKEITGAASLGWITKLYRSGKVLYADIKAVPKKIAELINIKAFGRFSPAIWTKLSIDGVEHDNVLEHLALLGAQLPANMGLDGFIDLYYETEINENLRTYENKIKEESRMDEPKIKTYEAEYKEAQSQLKTYEQEITELKTKNNELESKITEIEYSHKEKEVDSFLAEAVKEGKIAPSQVAMYKKMAMSGEKHEFSQDGKTEIKDAFESVKDVISLNPKMEFQAEKSDAVTPEKEDSSLDEGEKLDKEITAYMQANQSVSYREAYSIITKEK